MKRLLFTCYIFAFSVNHLCSQSLTQHWLQRFQGQGKASDRIAAIVADASGNVFVAGYAGNHHGSPDAFAMKQNAQGDTLWKYYYDSGAKNEDRATDIVIDNAGNAYITGYSENASYYDECFTAKILPSGSQAWVTRYSPGSNTQSYGNALVVDGSGNVYVAGYSDPSSASYDWLVIKYNSSGVQQWVDVLNGPGNGDDEAKDIIIAPNGNPTVCGYQYSVNASGNINSFVKQYTPANTSVWTDTWTNPSFTGADKAWGLAYNTAGDLFVGGETKNSTSSNQDAFAIRYTNVGTRIWTNIYNGAGSSLDEYFRQVTIDLSGNVFFTGSNYRDGFVTCIKSDGTLGWRKEWVGPVTNGSDVFHGIAVDEVGSVYATGRGVFPGIDYYGNGGLGNMIITKYNAQGDSLWTYRCMDSLNYSMGFSIYYLNGKVYAGGYVTDTASVNENLYTIIIDSSGNAVSEWKFNGQGAAITMGQLVQTDANNNVYCAATLDRLYGEGTDVVIVKYSPTGTLLWEKYYSSLGFNNDTITAMQFNPSGDLILCISTDKSKLKNNYRLSLVKVDANGNFLDTAWNVGGGSILATAMDIGFDGSVAIAANSNINGGMVIYFDSNLYVSWTAKLDSTLNSITKAYSIDMFLNNELIVAGYTQLSSVTSAIVQRYSVSGIKLWTTTIDSLNVYDEARDAVFDNTGNIAFAGKSGNTSMFGKINGTNGALIWRKIYNPTTSSNEYGVKVRFTSTGNIAAIVRGWTGYVARYYTIQYNGTGTLLWANVYSQTASDREPVDIIIDQSNRIITAGWAINTYSTNYDYVLLGYTSAGMVDFLNTYTSTGTASSTWDQLRDMTLDGQGNIIVTGQSATEFYNNYLYSMLTIKYGGIVVGQEEISEPMQTMATVYPNPSTGIFTILDASTSAIASANVYDMQGRIVAAIDDEAGQIDLQKSKSGIYVLVILRENLSKERILLVLNK